MSTVGQLYFLLKNSNYKEIDNIIQFNSNI